MHQIKSVLFTLFTVKKYILLTMVKKGQIESYVTLMCTSSFWFCVLGIQHAVGGLASKPERDLLMQDFMTVETTNFPSDGSNHTPAHHFSEFKFKNYAPIAFRYFRDLFGIQPDDFLVRNIAKLQRIFVIIFVFRCQCVIIH